MAEVLPVGSTRRPTLRISAYDADTLPSLSILGPDLPPSPLTLAGPVAQGDGSGLWTASAPYTLSLPGPWYERFTVTNAVSGLGAGAATVELLAEPAPPPSAVGTTTAWATVAQYMSQIGGAPPANLLYLLRVATLTLRPHIAMAMYNPNDAAVLATLAEACCLQVAYALRNGWTDGAPALAPAGKIGSIEIKPGARNDGGAGALPPIDPIAEEVLAAAGLLQPFVTSDEYRPWWWLL